MNASEWPADLAAVPDAPSPRVERVQIRGTMIYAEVRGEGPAILIIPGGAEDAEGWRPVAERLQGHLVLPLALVASGRTLEEAVPVGSLGAVVEAGRIEMAGSGFAITIPDAWTVEVAEPDPDVFSAEPGTAWWALRASAPYRSMACSLAVGVTDLPSDRWSTVGQDGGTTPYWDPSKPWKLRVPTPDIAQSISYHTSWIHPQPDQEADLEHDVLYALDCAANDVRVGGSARFWHPLVSSFEFLPVEE